MQTFEIPDDLRMLIELAATTKAEANRADQMAGLRSAPGSQEQARWRALHDAARAVHRPFFADYTAALEALAEGHPEPGRVWREVEAAYRQRVVEVEAALGLR